MWEEEKVALEHEQMRSRTRRWRRTRKRKRSRTTGNRKRISQRRILRRRLSR